MDPRSDSALIEACLAGKQSAWDALVERYARLVESVPRRYRFTQADCEDVGQAVFVKLFQNLGRIRDRERLASWLITTTHRESWRVGRASGRYSHLDDTFDSLSAPRAEDAEQFERQHLVNTALKKIGQRCEKLLRALFYEPGGSYQKLSDDLGVSVGSIGPTRARCLRKLEAALRAMGFDGSDLD